MRAEPMMPNFAPNFFLVGGAALISVLISLAVMALVFYVGYRLVKRAVRTAIAESKSDIQEAVARGMAQARKEEEARSSKEKTVLLETEE